MNITVMGGTGYAGAAIVREATRRGHEVCSLSRSQPAHPVAGVRYLTADAADDPAEIVDGADVVVGALSAKGTTLGTLVKTYRRVGESAAQRGARLVVVGGFGSVRIAPGEPRAVVGIDDLDIPLARVAEGKEMEAVREALADSAPPDLDWLFVCPAAEFGSYTPQGEPRGTYRVSDDVALFDADGTSAIEAADLALAVVDQIERPTHSRTQIHYAY